MKKFLRFTLAGLSLALLSSCATVTDPADTYQDETQQQIYQKGKAALEDHSYNEAIKRFEALDVQYPYGEETENAQFYLIYAYYYKEEYALSVAAADRFIRLHPANPHVDYAYYMRGISNYYQNLGMIERLFAIDMANRDLSQIKKSYDDFKTLVTNFPTSRYAPPAHQYMVYLRNVLANHELHIAVYYYDRGAYIAAANRASDVVAHYQGAPSVIPALQLMAKSYHALKLEKQEADVLKVMQFNGIAAK